MRRAAVVTSVAVVAVLAGGIAIATSINNGSDSTAVRGTVRKVVVSDDSGSVTIRPGHRTHVKRTEHWNVARPTYRQWLSKGVLTIESRCPSVPLNNCYVDIAITAPRAVTASVQTGNGNVVATGLQGASVSADTSNGTITFTDLGSRTIRGESSNGDVHVTLDARPRGLAISTSNGDVTATIPAGAYDIDTQTSNGNITVRGLRDDPSSDRHVSAETSNGSIVLRGR